MLKKYLKPLTAAIILSILLHLCFWRGLSLSPKTHKPLFKSPENIEISVVEAPPPVPKAQIVEQAPSINKEEPKNAKYLSAENQKVEKETRAHKTGDFNNEAGLKPSPPPRPVRPQRRQAQPKPPQQKPAPKKTPSQADKGTLSLLKDLTPKVDLTAQKYNAAQNRPSTPPQKQGKAGRQSATRDYIKDKEKGPQTLLNTRAFAYYSYYQRIRTKIQHLWEPAIKEKVRRILASGRKIASTQDRVTKVIIILNAKGQLVNVQVLGRSGIRDLDEAAVEAFRAAEPFPNPPKGIAEKDGKIRIRWDFILEV